MTIKLTVILSGRTLKRYEFDDGVTTIRIGRNPDCEVQIDNLGVSRYHCEILSQHGVLQLRDLDSNNGTFVNGGRVTVHNLNPGDTISMGKFSVRLESDQPATPEKPRNLLGGGDGMMTLQLDAASLAKKHREQLSRNRGYLAFDSGKELILERSLCTFGKDSGADVQLAGWLCPRVVAVLIKDETGFRLVDVSPKGNSVVVNGIHKRDTWLNDNDQVIVRRKPMVFHRGMPVGRAPADTRATVRL